MLLAGPTLTHLRAAARSDLNNAVYMFEARLNALVASEEAEGKPPFAFEVDYGERAEHCWNGKGTALLLASGVAFSPKWPAFSWRNVFPCIWVAFCPQEPAISRTLVAGR